MMHPKYDETLKKLYSKTPKDNFLRISYDYNKFLVFPYDEGIKFLACLRHAETMTEGYSKPALITGFKADYFQASTLSREDYENIKIAAMLNITLEELLNPTPQVA